MRPLGLSAFVRCKNEEEYIIASLMSAYRFFDEIVVILNNSTDHTRVLVEDIMRDHSKVRLLNYDIECVSSGTGYLEKVQNYPEGSLAKYYNWCLEQTTYSHVCKWDGDMIAIAPLEQAREKINKHDVIMFDGYDVLGEYTTDYEARIFKYNPQRARYVDWDLYEVLEHDYSELTRIEEKCYLHMKLVKNEWLHKQWVCPNLLAARSVPETGASVSTRVSKETTTGLRCWFRKILRSVIRRLGNKS